LADRPGPELLLLELRHPLDVEREPRLVGRTRNVWPPVQLGGPHAGTFCAFASRPQSRCSEGSVVSSWPSGSSRNRSRASCLGERAALPAGRFALAFLLGMQLLPLHLFHLRARPLASRPVPDLADSREDVLLLFPDVPLEARAPPLFPSGPALLPRL